MFQAGVVKCGVQKRKRIKCDFRDGEEKIEILAWGMEADRQYLDKK